MLLRCATLFIWALVLVACAGDLPKEDGRTVTPRPEAGAVDTATTRDDAATTTTPDGAGSCPAPQEARCGDPCGGSASGCLCRCGGGGPNYTQCSCSGGSWSCVGC